jgi:hypothetical protein
MRFQYRIRSGKIDIVIEDTPNCAALGPNASEQPRRLASAAVFGSHMVWNKSTRRPGPRREAGRQVQMAEDFDAHRRIFDPAIIFKAPPP